MDRINRLISVKIEQTQILFTIIGNCKKYSLQHLKKEEHIPSHKINNKIANIFNQKTHKNNTHEVIRLMPSHRVNEYSVNSLNVGDGQPLGEGIWYVKALEEVPLKIEAIEAKTYTWHYKEISKVNIYPHAQYSITVSKQKEDLVIQVENPLGEGYYDLKHHIKQKLFQSLSFFWGRRINHSSIIFLTTNTYKESGNGKILRDYIQAHPLHGDYSIETLNHSLLEQKGHLLEKVRILYKLLKAHYVFVEDYHKAIENLSFNPQTQIIQLWHAPGAYKKVGYSRFGTKGAPSLYKSAHRKYTKAIVSSELTKRYYIEAFAMAPQDVVVTGLPRTDLFLNPNYKQSALEKVYAVYPMCRGKKIILYAPTFREQSVGNQRRYTYDAHAIDYDELAQACGDTYLCLFKWHPFIQDAPLIPSKYAYCMMDVSTYPHINELLYLTQILITDYSSVIFDYALLNRPILLYTYDLEAYLETRGIYGWIEQIIKTYGVTQFDQVCEFIHQPTKDVTEAIVTQTFDFIDTKACERIINLIF